MFYLLHLTPLLAPPPTPSIPTSILQMLSKIHLQPVPIRISCSLQKNIPRRPSTRLSIMGRTISMSLPAVHPTKPTTTTPSILPQIKIVLHHHHHPHNTSTTSPVALPLDMSTISTAPPPLMLTIIICTLHHHRHPTSTVSSTTTAPPPQVIAPMTTRTTTTISTNPKCRGAGSKWLPICGNGSKPVRY